MELKALIIKYINEITEEIINIRRKIHTNPELGNNEYSTMELICAFLEKNNIEYTKNVAKTGVIALIKGDNPGKTIALRADMDALDINEENDIEYKSKNQGIMHACGHDAHVAILLGAAYVINSLKNKLSGNVKLIFQPNEEMDGGAKPMIEENVLKNPNVDAIAALHVSPAYDTGYISTKKGVLTASPDMFDLVINGRGGHGAHPELSIDPIIIGSQIVSAWQTILSRNTSALNSAVITVGQFHSGTNSNTIPDTAELSGTARAFSNQMRDFLAEKMKLMAESIANSYGASISFNYHKLYPPLINDDSFTDFVCEAMADVLGKDKLICEKEPSMIGEDFSYFAEEIPACMFYLGIKNKEKDCIYPLHSSKFNLDEDAIPVGIMAFSSIVIKYLA